MSFIYVPLPNMFAGDLLNDYRDRQAQVAYTTALLGQGETAGGGTATAGAAGQLPFGRVSTTTTINNTINFGGRFIDVFGIAFRATSQQVQISSLTNCRYFIGVGSATGNSFTSDDPTNDAWGFRFSSSASDTTWVCVCNGGGTNSKTSSGVTVAASTAYLLSTIAFAAKIEYYVNRVLVATHTTNLPRTSVTNYGLLSGVRTLAAEIKSLDLSFYNDRMHGV